MNGAKDLVTSEGNKAVEVFLLLRSKCYRSYWGKISWKMHLKNAHQDPKKMDSPDRNGHALNLIQKYKDFFHPGGQSTTASEIDDAPTRSFFRLYFLDELCNLVEAQLVYMVQRGSHCLEPRPSEIQWAQIEYRTNGHSVGMEQSVCYRRQCNTHKGLRKNSF